MPKLLIIDDEPSIRLSIKAVFNRKDVTVLGAATVDEGIQLAAEQSPEVILLDIKLGSFSGLDVFHELRRIDPRSLIIFITGFGTTDTAIEAMKLGAYDYLTKPLEAQHLKQVVDQAIAISRLAHVPTIIDEGDRPEDRPDRLIGSSSAMQTVCKQIGRVAPQNVNVLILGESGTGKELVARAIYHHSRRRQAPFLAMNCAAIPESLLEAELFGHERGAFTGADRRRIGKFEQCHGGTLFLDEVGDMAPHTQAKILRLIQEGRFERLGGSESISVDVRILAATNQDLDLLIGQGRFRKDLYYRLCAHHVHIPPLRERCEDLPALVDHFLERASEALGKKKPTPPSELFTLLATYSFPGNVRELQSMIYDAVSGHRSGKLSLDVFKVHLRKNHTAPGGHGETFRPAENALLSFCDRLPTLKEGERLLVSEALRRAKGNQAIAALTLGISRQALNKRLKQKGK